MLRTVNKRDRDELLTWLERDACTVFFNPNTHYFSVMDSYSRGCYIQSLPIDPMMRTILAHERGCPTTLKPETIEHEKRMRAYTAFMMSELDTELEDKQENLENRLALWKEICQAIQFDRHTHRTNRLFATTWEQHLTTGADLTIWLAKMQERGQKVPTWHHLIDFRYRVVLFLYVSISTSFARKKKMLKKHKQLVDAQWGMLPIDILKNVFSMLVEPRKVEDVKMVL